MPLDREAELRRLAQADTLISNAERAITDQMIELDKLRRDGHDTKLAEQTLKLFEDTLQTLHKHREHIVKTINQIDRGLA
jgi:hypothetical protein